MIVHAMMAAALFVQAAPQQFDLVCEGRMTPIGTSDGPIEWSARYRLDLSRRVWCERGCSELNSFAAVGTTEIVLQRQDRSRGAMGNNMDIVIDRTTGRLTGRYRADTVRTIGLDVHATCEPATFSGMPQNRF
ncbi:MAG: hypothetical protein DWQ53_09855 [Microcystis flos-aquae DF17]|nr:MAG: hypothetical protein DWQ53_09855 [Microcystis flos-aquae DF17]